MDIHEMTEQEKSKKLVELCGWEPAIIKGYGSCWIDKNYDPVCRVHGSPYAIEAPNLYHPQNMSLAWRVLNWARLQKGCPSLWHEMQAYKCLTDCQPEIAQSAWLDKILELAIRYKMVK